MLIDCLYHPLLHDAAWMWTMDIYNTLQFGREGTKFGTNLQNISNLFLFSPSSIIHLPSDIFPHPSNIIPLPSNILHLPSSVHLKNI